MKKKALAISIFIVSSALAVLDTPKIPYSHSGQAAVRHLIETGKARFCDLSNEDLREAIATIRRKGTTISIDFSNANLAGTNLAGADLKYACLGTTNLSGANLEGANLTHASLSSADLTNANLTSVNLTNANLAGTNLTNADLTGANFANALLVFTNMTGANTTGADMTSAQFLHTVKGYTSKKTE